MEAPQKMVLPGEVHPVRNSSGALPPGIIIKPDSAAAAGPESSGPAGTAGHYF